MQEDFSEPIYYEVAPKHASRSNIIKAADISLVGDVKVSIDEDSHDTVNILIKKDAADNIHEIKFMCSCGKTKSIALDYSE